jgi:aspartate ammonia-lyase
MLYNSVGIITALCPVIGYKKSAQLAKRALKENRQVKDLILEEKLLDKQMLDIILDPYAMTSK